MIQQQQLAALQQQAALSQAQQANVAAVNSVLNGQYQNPYDWRSLMAATPLGAEYANQAAPSFLQLQSGMSASEWERCDCETTCRTPSSAGGYYMWGR